MTEAASKELVSKLTIKELGCNPKAVLALPEGQIKMPLCQLYGLVTRVGFQENRDEGRTYTYFLGDFEGVNLQDGTTAESSKLYLPQGPSEALEQICAKAFARNKNAQVQFAFEVLAVKSSTNKAGYSYETRVLVKPEEADKMGALRNVVKEHSTGHDKSDAGTTREKGEAGKGEAGTSAREHRKSA